MGRTLNDTEWFYAQNVLSAIDGFLTSFEEDSDLSILRKSVEKHEAFPSGIVNQKRELYTKRELIEPVFTALGYDDWTKEPADLMPDERKRPDYCIDDIAPSCTGISEIKPLGLLNEMAEEQNDAEEQTEYYLRENTLTKYRRDLEVTTVVGIATDGLLWTLYAKDRDGTEIHRLNHVDIARVFNRAILARQYPDTVDEDWHVQERDFLEREFAPVFAKPLLVDRVADAV